MMLQRMSFMLLLLMLSLLSTMVSCDPFHTGFEDMEQALYYRAKVIEAPPLENRPLKIVTWNIKYGGARLLFFWECGGTRYNMTKKEVLHNMDLIVEKIIEMDPDILLLQEVDVLSKRSAYVDQVQYILDRTKLNHGVYASGWKADYIPSDGLGRMDMGNAILSKWPMEKAKRIALPLIGNYSFIEKYFYLKRNIVKADVVHPEGTFTAVNIHAEAFAEDDTKWKHIQRFERELMELNADGKVFIAGGDLNSIPRDSPQRKGFDDDSCGDARFEGDDYTGEDDWLDGLFSNFFSAMDPAVFAADPAAWYTFTGDPDGFWNRCLDYLFSNRPFVPGTGRVLQSADPPFLDPMDLSDHAPVEALWEVVP